MKLKELLKGVKCEIIGQNVDITSIEHQSQFVKKNSIFIALEGSKTNGENYILEAISNGAKAILINEKSKNINKLKAEHKTLCTFVLAENPREAFALCCKNLYLKERLSFELIGITGTNGKTTISFMLQNALMRANFSVGVVGTSGIFVNGEQIKGEGLTTPDPKELYQTLNFFNELKLDYVIMEVSAHALALSKTDGLNFKYGIFTNLTEDHLDFFKTMENYGNAKAKFFNSVECAIFNVDDEFGLKLYKNFSGYKKAVSLMSGDYIYQNSANVTKINYDNTHITLKSYLCGLYNSTNTAEAFAVLNEIINKKQIKKAFLHLPKIDGRFNIFKSKHHGKIILDFAHTPDGLEKILKTAHQLTRGKGVVFSVFGCGGNRDRDKRHIMGEVSGRLADYTYISIDNPRYEDENSVMSDVERGIKKVTNNYNIVMPRSLAILKAYQSSTKNDVIVVSGKGMEPYYEVMGEKLPYREDLIIKSIIKNYDNV